ncbi:MAG: nucleoside monophosphate kinase, partial [bacterium]|nr:nucleoside monophosphate kinase [bacterium]
MKQKKTPQVIIIIGPPGSGKGTQAKLLAEKFDLYHWDTSKIVGRLIAEAKRGEFVIVERKKYYFEEERKRRLKGLLWNPSFTNHLIKEKIMELAEEKESIAMTGSPRTLEEGRKLAPFLKKLYGVKNIKVIAIQL